MNLFSKEIKVCKCGHDSKTHKNKLFNWNSECKLCPCTDFVNRKYGSKLDTIITYILGFASFGLAGFAMYAIIDSSMNIQANPDVYAHTMQITLKTVFEIMNFVMAIFIFYMGSLGLQALLEHQYRVKRKTLPVDDGTRLKTKDEILAEIDKTEKELCEFYHTHPEVTNEPILETKLQTLRWALNQQELK